MNLVTRVSSLDVDVPNNKVPLKLFGCLDCQKIGRTGNNEMDARRIECALCWYKNLITKCKHTMP